MTGLFLQFIFRGLRFRPLRSWLTVLGIVIGIMLVSVILALGDGLEQTVRGTLQAFGSDLIVIIPGKATNPLLSLVGGARFRISDFNDLVRADGVKFVLPVDHGIVTAEYKGEKQSVLLHAQDWEHYVEILETSQGQKLASGRYPSSDTAAEVVLGSAAASTLFRQPVRVGDDLIIGQKRFKVIGTFTSAGEQNHDSAVFISLTMFHALTGNTGTAASAVVKVEAGADVGVVAQEIRYRLSKQSVVEDFTVLTPDKANELVDSVLNVVEIALMVIALVSLLVGGVGVMNTMYTSVLERTKQIGVLKAIGATPEAILTLFLIESGVIGMIGGVLGIALGLAAADAFAYAAASFGVRGLFSWSGVDYVGAAALLAFTFIVGIIAGYLPARAGSRLEPAEALRYE